MSLADNRQSRSRYSVLKAQDHNIQDEAEISNENMIFKTKIDKFLKFLVVGSEAMATKYLT